MKKSIRHDVSKSENVCTPTEYKYGIISEEKEGPESELRSRPPEPSSKRLMFLF